MKKAANWMAKSPKPKRNNQPHEGRDIVHRLEQAELHILQATKHVERQRKLIAVLEADGPARLIPEATKLLRYFEKELSMHIKDRDRLAKELDQIKSEALGKQSDKRLS
jgi:hypothetical protein